MRLDREHALALDAADPLRAWRERFVIPHDPDGKELVYLCGHSLGAQPVLAADYVEEVMRDWRLLGVEGHFSPAAPGCATTNGSHRRWPASSAHQSRKSWR